MSAPTDSIYSTNTPRQTQVHISGDRPGSGKTQQAIENMATIDANWLYVVDRIDVIEDRIERIQIANKNVAIHQIHTTNVAEQITFWNANHKLGHQILIITHEGLQISDLAEFKGGWRLVIDEVFEPFISETVNSKINSITLDKLFTINGGKLSIKRDMDIRGLYQDTTIDDSVRKLYNAAKKGTVFISTDTFHTDKSWHWYSVYNFKNLEVFECIYIYANSIQDSMMYKFMVLAEFEFNVLQITAVPYASRKVTVRYFDENNQASHKFFESDIGMSALSAITAYYDGDASDRIWTKNDSDMDKLVINGLKLRPKVAGSNKFKNRTKAAIIYKSKPAPHEIAMLKAFNISADELIRARELETIIQFVTRTSIREAGDDRACEFDVYDKVQATGLKTYLDGLDIGLDVQLYHIDCSIPVREIEKRGRKANSGKTKAERQAEYRARKKRIKENLRKLNNATASQAQPEV